MRATPFRSGRFGSRVPALLFLMTPFLVAGCGGDSASEALEADATSDGAPVEMSPSPMDTALHSTIILAAVGGSGVTGEAMSMHSDDLVVLFLELQGLPNEGSFPAHIHSGTCEGGGPVAVRLNPVSALPDGTGTSITTLDAEAVPTSGTYFVQVHGEANAPIACGDLLGHGQD